jgi:hypothetical protein
VRMGSRGRGGNLSCEWVVVAEVRDGEVVVRITKYSETEDYSHASHQVLGDRGILSCRVRGSRTVSHTLLA